MGPCGQVSGQAQHSRCQPGCHACCPQVFTVHITFDSLQYNTSMP